MMLKLNRHLLTGLFLLAGCIGQPCCAATAARGMAPTADSRAMLERFRQGPMAGVEEIIFAVRPPGKDPHWYANFAYYSDRSDEPSRYTFGEGKDGVLLCYGEGARLCSLDLASGQPRVLLDDPRGGIRDPQIHYDGRKILFSYRPGGDDTYHLYEIDVDGRGLKQLTFGPDDDIEPTYCPDGSIVFSSARCRRVVNCWYTRVGALYRCDGDGTNIRMLSSNNDHDNTPWVLPDGRVLYMRWEYVDRSQVHYHHLWTVNPDGTSQTVFFGNQSPGIVMIDAKPIPNTNKVVSVFSPGHGRRDHDGAIAVVDPRLGPDSDQMARTISKKAEFRDPYAFSEDCFLVAGPRGIMVMDGTGATEVVYRLPDADAGLQCHEPRPLVPRPRERVIPPRVDLAEPTGRLVLENIYAGRKMRGVKPGSVKKLLVLKQLPKPVNFSGGMQPLTIGGSFTLAEIVGTVPVEADGSAYMEVPALESIFFVALDEKDLSVKRMHSFHISQPGETTSCVGCHEPRTTAPLPVGQNLLAMGRRPSRPQPVAGVPAVIDYPRDIQPILDRHCTECHNAERYDGGVDLCGDKTSMYTVSYWTMQTRGLVADGRNRPESNYDPYMIGSSASRLISLIDQHHQGVELSTDERAMVRLWIDTSATYPGTYAALGCGYYPAPLPFGPLKATCGGCHGSRAVDKYGEPYDLYQFGQFATRTLEPVYNISRPEKSRLLLAPLAKSAGGLELCRKAVFKSTADPLYRDVLSAVKAAHQSLVEGKRFDDPGFVPNEHYRREMQRYGFLAHDAPADRPIDAYALDRAYWDSFAYRPLAEPGRAGQRR